MDFDNIKEYVSPETGGLPQDSRCSDADFAKDHLGLCPNQERLILKPEMAAVCLTDGTLQFAAYLSDNDGETALVADVTYASKDVAVLTINGSTGAATLVAAGIVTVTATYLTKTAYAQVQVMAGTDCEKSVSVATVLLVDNSRSMGARFDPDYPNRLAVAKKLAHHFARQVSTDKVVNDVMAVCTFNEAYTIEQHLTDTIGDQLTPGSLVRAIAELSLTDLKTDLYTALANTMNYLSGSDADRKVIVLFSDGEQRPLLSLGEQAGMVNMTNGFQQEGGLLICVGIRAGGDGYCLLRTLASGGYFINVLDGAGVVTAIGTMAGLQGYYAAGARPMADDYDALTVPPAAQAPETDMPDELELSVPCAG